MDKVLTRKLFKDRYFKLHKPAQFNKGGIASVQHFVEGGLSSKEKGLLAATFAAPLLKSTRRPGEGIFSGVSRALGEGFERVPATLIELEKAKPKVEEKTEIRQATDAEKEQMGVSVDANYVVKVKGGEIQDIVKKPTAGEESAAATREASFRAIDQIESLVDKVGTGPVSGRVAKAQAFLGMNKDAADLNVYVNDFKKTIIQALRGAQVGVAEEQSFNDVLPAITDPPDIIKAKMKIAREKLSLIESRLNPSGTVAKKLEAEEIAAQDRALFEKFGIAFDLDTTHDPSVSTFTVEGVEVE